MITYKIHQIKDIENTVYAFRGYDPKKFNFKDYECRYTGEFTDTVKTATEICEVIYYLFNMRRPEDFRGHGLSMSDVIEIITDLTDTLYYCDLCGWQRIAQKKKFKFWLERQFTNELKYDIIYLVSSVNKLKYLR